MGARSLNIKPEVPNQLQYQFSSYNMWVVLWESPDPKCDTWNWEIQDYETGVLISYADSDEELKAFLRGYETGMRRIL